VNWYQHHIVAAGKQPLLVLFVSLFAAFLVTRVVVRMIRAGRGPFRNIRPGGMHIHHVVPGMFLMIIGGVGGFSADDHPWAEIFAGVFGVGTALVLDEFALVLHLDDVYWEDEGRSSVDVTVLTIAFIGVMVVSASPVGPDANVPSSDTRWVVMLNLLLVGVLLVIALLKGKIYSGLFGIFLFPLAVVAAIRLGRPGSPWAHWRYRGAKLERARRRDETFHARWVRRRHRLQDLVAGRPASR
jgi:hypothetical protein